ncbi:MAG: 16S rRNA (cytosine(1402)-N(4))-methyltransferase, partial [Acidobacteriota bacterium]
MASIHRSVMVREVMELLDAGRGGVFVDATFGGGGHTRAILAAHPDNRVMALDRDPEAVASGRRRLGPSASRVDLIHADFRDLEQLLEGRPRPDGLLADLGVSSDQLLD